MENLSFVLLTTYSSFFFFFLYILWQVLENRQSLDLNSLIPRPPLVSFPGLPQSHSQASPSLIPRSPLPPVSFPGLPYLIPRPPLPPAFDCLWYAKTAYCKRSKLELGNKARNWTQEPLAMAALSNLILMLQLPCNIFFFLLSLILLGASKFMGYFHPSGSSYRSELSCMVSSSTLYSAARFCTSAKKITMQKFFYLLSGRNKIMGPSG